MSRSAIALVRLLPPPDAASPDAPLLRAFLSSTPASGEAAFAELVRRHGPMVLAVCRRVLGNPHDADDAFQATFLILARKAGTIRGNLAGWLYAVAVRTARGVRVMRDRRRKHELLAHSGQEHGEHSHPDHDLAAVIDEELAKLPDHYREAIVLCELRGLSRKQAAVELGIPEGTLSSRLAGAKRKLASLLSARGLAAPTVLVPLLAPAAVSAALTRAALAATRGAVSSAASAAAGLVMKGMLFDQLKAVIIAAGVLLTAVCGGWAMTSAPGGDHPAAAPAPRATEDTLAPLIAQLAAPEYADREAAAGRLRTMGLKAESALRSAARSENPEVRARCEKLLIQIRRDARDLLVKQFNPATDIEPDHPVWKRFKTIAGNDDAARKLFAAIIANPRLLQLLDDADRSPQQAGDLYGGELKRWYSFAQNLPKQPNTGVPRPGDTPYTEAVAIMYLGSYPSSTGKTKEGWRWEGHLFIDSWSEVMKSPVGPAVKRIFAAWLPLRDNPDTRERGLAIAAEYRVGDALPFARKVLSDEKDVPEQRAQAALLLGILGVPSDRALLRRVAESKLANEHFIHFSVVLRGQRDLDVLWGAQRFGMKKIPDDMKRAAANADIRTGDRSVADCAWAAAVQLAGGKPEQMGFLWPRTAKGETINDYWFVFVTSHGFETPQARSAAHAKAKEFLDEQKDKPDQITVKLVEQLGAAEFADRESAEKQLKELGIKAKPAVMAGLKSESPEVLRRCQAVLNHLRREEAQAAFLKAAGDDEQSRALLAEVLKDPHLARVLDEAVQHPERSGKLYAAEQWRLWQKAVSTPPGAKEADIPTAPEIALSFLLGAHPSSANALETEPPPNDSRITEGRRAVESGLLCKSLQLELIDPKRQGPYARLMAGWLAARSDPWLVSLGLSEARQYRLTEIVPVARQVVRRTKLDAQHRAAAALALADLGGKAEMPVLRELMDDKTEYSRFFEGRDANGPTFTVELRDVAVGAALLLSGQEPGEFGFPRFHRQALSDLKLHEKLNGQLFAFVADADRAATHKKAREWLDKQKP